jgi:hypothetical protein
MVADSTNLYWTVGGGEGAGYIVSVGLGGSIFSTIVTGLDNPGAVTWDATSLYWIDTLSGSVTSVTPK